MFQTALRDWHAARGAKLVEFAGWEMPIQFTSIVDEHHAVRRRAGMFDIAHMGRLWFRGPQQVELLDHLLTNHVAKMPVGQVRYALVCNEQGGILDDVLVTRFADECLLVVNGANREKIWDWIGRHRGEFDADVTDATRDTFMVAIQGPASAALLQPHVDTDLSAIKYYHAAQATAFGFPAVVSRTGYTGEDGFELIVDNRHAVSLADQLVAAGQEAGLALCGLGCRDTLRLEAAMPLYGHEMDESVDPFTAGLDFGVKLNKPEFLGQAALRAIKNRGGLPKRVGLKLAGKRIARQGAELYKGANKVGDVTSGTFSPTLEAALAMGYVPAELSQPGTQIDVDIRGKREPAEVVTIPFYKRATVG